MEQLTDNIETLILMALDANHSLAIPREVLRLDGMALQLRDQGELLRIGDMAPSSAYTFDSTDRSRIFGTTKDYLVNHPAEILGDESETIMINDGVLKWHGCRRMRKAPRGISCLGKAAYWYEVHIRFVTKDGSGAYYKRIVPLSNSGDPLPAKVQGHSVCCVHLEGEGLILMASMIEDAHRSGAMLAEVKDATEIKFPVPLGDYKDVFSGRDGPMNGARRKSILHWVAKHLRNSTQGKEHEVRRHARGIHEFTCDGLRIRLTPNA